MNKTGRRPTPMTSFNTSVLIHFDITIPELQELMRQEGDISVDKLEQFGGREKLYDELYTSPEIGIRGNALHLDYRRNVFGSNIIEQPKSKTYFQLILISLNDPILIFLLIGGLFSLLASLLQKYFNRNNENYDESYEWIEGVAIIITVLIIVLVTATTDYEKEKQFRYLQDKLKNDQKIPVIRNGEIKDILINELVVGDVCLIKYGNSIPADGIIIQSNDLKVDESALTGESDLVIKDVYNDCIVLCGTNVMEGSAKILIIAVGIYTQNGIILTLLGLTTTEPKNDITEVDSVNIRKVSANIATLKKNKRTISNVNNEMTLQNNEIDLNRNKSILQVKLLQLAYNISKGAILIATLLIIVLLIEFIRNYIKNDEKWDSNCVRDIIDFIITGISLLVIAIPEGLPLAVTLSLAYSVSKMTYDNNLVRNLAACETMGNATIICSDKTGTLTTNRMECVELYTCEKLYKKIPKLERLSDISGKLILECISINSLYTSRLIISKTSSQIQQIGNKTECALLGLVNELGGDYELIRTKYPENEFIYIYTFNSTRKSMSTVIKLKDNDNDKDNSNDNANGNGKNNSNSNDNDNANNSNDIKYRLYTKGASEIIMYKCSYIYDINGKIDEFTNDMKTNMYNKVILPMGNNGLRTISLAYRDFLSISTVKPKWEDEDNINKDLILLCVCGIEDPVRPEVPKAIRLCQLAGINIKMVTGDNKETAKSIAIKCGIFRTDDTNGLIMESNDFNKNIRDTNGIFNQKKFDKVWPRLRVLARSSPIDKYVLVKGIIDSKISRHREIVAVTGDGTNDGPALKVADVGFAMGIAGTDVAKGASDIIITDDNFYSIVKAVMWGRNVYDSIAKFIQFQLTVNLVAVIIAFLTAVYTNRSVLKAVQLLWVNLIMDSLASLALATEKPTEQILKRKPYGRMKSIISAQMFVNIILQTIYQLIVLFIIFIYFDKLLNIPNGSTTKHPTKHYTLLFNALVVMTLFNEINSRKLNGELNVLEGLFNNYIFIIIWLITMILQFTIVQYGSYIFHTKPLNIQEWICCILFGIGTTIWSTIYNRLPLKMYVLSIYYSCCKSDIHHVDTEIRKSSEDYLKPWSRTKRITTQINVLNKLSAIKEENERSRILAATHKI